MIGIGRLSALFIAAVQLTAVSATTYTPGQHLVINGDPNGFFAYMYSNGSLLEVATSAPATNPSGFNTWIINRSPAQMAAFGIVDVTPLTTLAGFGYGSPQTGALAQRLFYQTNNGDIRTAFHSGLSGSPGWVVDSTVIANVPLGTVLSAFVSPTCGNLGKAQAIFVHYTDANGVLTQRFATADSGPWSAPVAINTP